jgi:predicted short-subunit dehydrogenase-like oxidoreductase (DUF2520 family)
MKPSPGAKLSINIIGAGRAGKALGYLWHSAKSLRVQDLVNSSLKSANSSVRVIGSGRATDTICKMRKAELYMLSVPDAEIRQVVRQLANCHDLTNSVVFHLSGALTSEILLAAKEKGALIASAHPAKSFADSLGAAKSFAGTVVALEGDRPAKIILRKIFKKIKANTIDLRAQDKVVYHASLVLASNYMQALLKCGYDSLFSVVGNKEDTKKILSSLASEALGNFFSLGASKALTGPIIRGDFAVVEAHLLEFTRRDNKIAEVYRALGVVALEIARDKLTPAQFRAGKKLLKR